ncbi:phosphoadenosine phosphosulfate reductase [Celeribacter marinus]|uniref:phosphoadenosine phosphosulfate reductase n=1 Tax=Celeribacter marinus TaxID=1397108 RepID=UPI003F6D5008
MTYNETVEPSKQEWRASLREVGAREGFYEELGRDHTALLVKRGDTLIVTFENLDDVYADGKDKMPWGYGFVERRGWSMLGMMAHDWTWYRDEAVFDFFDRLKAEGFFNDYKRVIFYGASMGGYAAAAFSAAHPGAGVVLISPQATLSRADASWETRYRKGWSRDFTSRYGFAPDMVKSAEYVYLFYDPLSPLDAMHAALFRGENLRKMRCRYFGHRIASLWVKLGILTPIVEGAISGTLTDKEFYHLLRRRRDERRYQKEMLARLQKRGRAAWVAHYCAAIIARAPGPVFRRALKEAKENLKR